VEEKEELELRCAQLKGDAKMYRQQNKQTLRQLEEVIRERDKVRSRRRKLMMVVMSETEFWLVFQALAAQGQQQEEARLLLQDKDQYREQVRHLSEQSDKLELLLLRSQGEELQLRTRLRKITCNSHQVRRRRSRVGEGNICDAVMTKDFPPSVRGV